MDQAVTKEAPDERDVRQEDLEDELYREAVLQHAQYLGVDPQEEGYLLSIVEAGSDGMDTFNSQVKSILLDALANGTVKI